MNTKLCVTFLLMLIVVVSLTACGGKEYNYVSANEDHTSPGLLSGEDGVFHLISYQKKDEPDVPLKDATQ